MRKILILGLLAAAAVTVPPSFAEVNVADQTEIVSDALEVERKAIIVSNLSLTEEESKEFWPVYNQYREEMKEVNDRLIAMIRKYAENYENHTDAVAADLMTEGMDIEQDRQIYKRLYIQELLDILPTKKVAVLYQIENKIEAAVKYDLSLLVPLVEVAPETAKTAETAETTKMKE